MSSNRHALIIVGALFHSPPLADLVETARTEGRQVVFAGAAENVTPRFPDWVIEVEGADPFDGTNLAAQLRAVGIAHVHIIGPDAAVAAAQAHGFDIEGAPSYA